MSEENNNDNAWKDALPESVQSMKIVQDATSSDQFWQRIQDQQEYLGRSITIPGEDAGDASWEEFNNKLIAKVPSLMHTPNLDDPESLNNILAKLGKPEDIEGYSMPEGDEMSFAENQTEFLKEVALNAGLTKGQFAKFAKALGESQFKTDAANKEYFESQNAELQKEWGAATDERTKMAINFAEKSGAPEGLIDSLKNNEVDASTVQWLYAQSKNLSEGGMPPQDLGNNNPGRMTPAEAEDRIQEIYNNPNHPYHANDPAAVKRFMELVGFANGNAA